MLCSCYSNVSLLTASDKETGILQDLKILEMCFHIHSPQTPEPLTDFFFFSKILANTHMVHNDKVFLIWSNYLILKLNKCNTINGKALPKWFKKVLSSLINGLGMQCWNNVNQKQEIILHSIQIKFRLFAVHIRKIWVFSHLTTTAEINDEQWVNY